MGEQTPAQIDDLPKPESHSLPPIETPKARQDSSDAGHQLPHPSPAADPEIPHVPQNPSKIPIRPQKIRKLSTATEKPSISLDESSASASSSLALCASSTPSSAKNRRRSASQSSRALPLISKPLTAEGEIESAIRHLRAADPVLAPLIDTLPPPEFTERLPPFHALAKSILYQQLALKAGTTIYNRFVALCGGSDSVCPDTVLTLTSQQLKQIGVSGRKASYIYDLANKYKSGILSDNMVVKMDDKSLFTMLTMVKGIGSWSVQMFMMFSLQRPDILPVSDLGVRKGVQMLYGLDELPKPSQLEQLCEKWRPYRSVGAWYMWRITDAKAAAGSGGLEGGVVQPLQQIEPRQDGHQHQLQFVEPVNGIGNMGACIWNQ
ncbi:DNA glycosylase superfamily protein [Striga hermonthica]|uniref:DNA glycosylase superfamily protein n=1 Tax=Striga hermonthica TaxID=68872 RepID=A0A9N7RSG3_STRHE|nr:DNA glycosylase superfamily protein [Striga hermonthica]